MVQLTESDYKIAQQGNAKVRQEFLDAIDLEGAGEFVRRVKYDCSSSVHFTNLMYDQKVLMATKNEFYFWKEVVSRKRLIKEGKPIVDVYPLSFDSLSYNSFFSVLIDHEGYHARQKILNYGGLKKVVSLRNEAKKSFRNNPVPYNYYSDLVEFPALLNQFLKFLLKADNKQEEIDFWNGQLNICLSNLLYNYSQLENPRILEEDLRLTIGEKEGERSLAFFLGDIKLNVSG